MWVLYSSANDTPIWKSDDIYHLQKVLAELSIALGDKFYIDKPKQ